MEAITVVFWYTVFAMVAVVVSHGLGYKRGLKDGRRASQ